MKPETRVKRLLNQVKREYNIKDKFNIRVIKGKTKPKHLMTIEQNKIPLIRVYINNWSLRFENLSDRHIKHGLAHELVHFLIHKHKKEEDPKKLTNTLKLINEMIDCW